MSRYKATGFAVTFTAMGLLGGASLTITLLLLGGLFLFGLL
jgi:hypothetical protein